VIKVKKLRGFGARGDSFEEKQLTSP
jgi:hypothetical protein